MSKKTISRRDFIISMAATSAVMAGYGNSSQQNNLKDPNIVFFLADDQRNDTLGCAGHPIVQTPNIDSLANKGSHFQNAFVTTSICPSSRATILTGLYERTHQYSYPTPDLQEAYIANSYPKLLREHGYKTGFIGKLGVSVPEHSISQMFDYFERLPARKYFYKLEDGTLRHESDLSVDYAIDFIRENQDNPFSISVNFNAPHADPTDFENHYP